MPSFSELRDQMWNHLRTAADQTSAESSIAASASAISELERRTREDLARFTQHQLLYRQIAAVRPAMAYDPSTGERRPFSPSDYGQVDNYLAPARTPTRPPAKDPTSTTTIGEAEAIDEKYAALVADLGINSGAVDLESFKALVPRAGLRVYDDEEVKQYLHGKYAVPVGDLSPMVLWGWRPLREADRVSGPLVQFNGRIQRSAPTYTKPIPLPVLLTVKTVRDACPSAKFFISDEMQGERIPDPFLLVEIGGHQFVIERWDEPAFKAKA